MISEILNFWMMKYRKLNEKGSYSSFGLGASEVLILEDGNTNCDVSRGLNLVRLSKSPDEV